MKRGLVEFDSVGASGSLREKLRRTGSVRKVDDRAQRLVFSVVQRCAPIKLGKTLLASFPPLAGTSSLPDERLLSCIGGRVGAVGSIAPPISGSVARFFSAEPYSRTPNELQTLAVALYTCAPDVTSGPIAQELGLTNAQTKCVTGEARHSQLVIADLTNVIFGRGGPRSETLNRLIEICIRDPEAFLRGTPLPGP